MINLPTEIAAPTSGPLMAATIGDRGPDVAIAQMALGVAADGIYGPGTAKALKKWQGAAKLTPDGQLGPVSWESLRTKAKPLTDNASPEALSDYLYTLRFHTLFIAAVLKDAEGLQLVSDFDLEMGLPLQPVEVKQAQMSGAAPLAVALAQRLAVMGAAAWPVIARFGARAAVWTRASLSRLPSRWSGFRKVNLPSGVTTFTMKDAPIFQYATSAARLAQRLTGWLGAGVGIGAAAGVYKTVTADGGWVAIGLLALMALNIGGRNGNG